MSTPKEITWVELSGGRRIDSALCVCPVCTELDLSTDFDTSAEPFVLTCSKGHKWTAWPTEGNVERTN